MKDEEIYQFFSEVKQVLSAHTAILNESIKPDISEIKEHLKTQNGRIKTVEEKINERDIVCGLIQDRKVKKTVWDRWAIGIALTLLISYVGWATNRAEKKVPVELFFQKTDSTMHVPRMYFRDDKGGLREVSIDYYNMGQR